MLVDELASLPPFDLFNEALFTVVPLFDSLAFPCLLFDVVVAELLPAAFFNAFIEEIPSTNPAPWDVLDFLWKSDVEIFEWDC